MLHGQGAQDVWHTLHPFLLCRPGVGGIGGHPNQSGTVIDVEDSLEGLMVADASGELRPATDMEMMELAAHQQQTREEAKQEEEADAARWEQMQATKYREWEEWCVSSAMEEGRGRSTKRVKVSVQVKGHGGRLYGSADIAVEMPFGEVLSYVVTPMEQPEPTESEGPEQDRLEEEIQKAAADEEVDIATQACRVEDDHLEDYVRDIDLDTEVGQNYYRLWRQGWITDDMVVCYACWTSSETGAAKKWRTRNRPCSRRSL